MTQISVPVDVKDSAGAPVAGAEVTVAAVDEGIHSITDYKNPDPYGWLGRARRPDFRRAHYYDKVVYDFTKPGTGGDMGNDMAKRASAVEDNWIRPVSLWSAVLTTDANGRATAAFDVPEFNGQLRIVAVAAAPVALGANSANLLVRRPFILRTSMPRFVLPGDKAQCRATVFNNSDAPAKVTVSWSVAGTLASGQGAKDLQIAPHKDGNLLAEIVAGSAVGQGEIRWSAVAFDASGKELEKLEQTALMPVRPPAAYQTANDFIVVAPGETKTLKNERFLDDARASLDIAVSANPTLRLKDALQFVVGYPYGCVEQTTSRLLPMYLLRKNQDLVATTLDKDQRLDGFIQAGISRLFSMQTPGGGLSMWPGGSEPYPYGSVYALHFLTLVKNGRDFELPDESFKLLQNYVRGLTSDWSATSESDLYRRAYAIYVLALDGDMEAIRQIERFDTVQLPTSARYLLAAALARNTRDTDRVKLYLEKTPSKPYDAKEQAGTLNSEIRNHAVEMIALRQMKGDSKRIADLATELSEYLIAHRYGTTQETSFIIAALAEHLADVAAGLQGVAATISGDGKDGSLAGNELYRAKHEGAGGTFTVANTGTAAIYVSLTSAGVPKEAATTVEKEGMTLVRRVMTNRGGAFSGSNYAHGDSYVVDLELTSEGVYKNVILTDLLPAGFEIENPRLSPDALSGEKFQDAVSPTHLELRDDRLVLAFDELSPGPHHFYYVVRAVTPGTFQQPSARIECMYDPRFHATSEAGTVNVQPRAPQKAAAKK